MAKCFIGIGKVSQFYKYILGCVFFNVAQFLVINYCNSVLKKRHLIQSIYKHFGFILFGFIFFFVFKHCILSKKRYSTLNKPKKSKDDEDDNKNHWKYLMFINSIWKIIMS